jgi:hypothetical protein
MRAGKGWLQSRVLCLFLFVLGFVGAGWGFLSTGWRPPDDRAYLMKIDDKVVALDKESTGAVESSSPGSAPVTASSVPSQAVSGGHYPPQPYPQGFSNANKGDAPRVPQGPYRPLDYPPEKSSTQKLPNNHSSND